MKIIFHREKRHRDVFNILLIWEILLVVPFLLQYIGIEIFHAYSSQYGMIIAVLMLFRVVMVNKTIQSKNIITIMLLVVVQLLTVAYNGTISSLMLSLAEVVMVYLFVEGLVYYSCSIDGVEKLWKSLMVIALLLCLLNFFINGMNVFFFWQTKGSMYSAALSSVFSNKNTWGQFLFPICIISFFSLMQTKRIRYVVITGVLVWNLISSFSRTSLFCFLIFVLVFILLYKRWGIKKNIGLILVGLIVIYISNLPKVKYFVDSFYVIKDSSFTGRSSLWAIGLYVFNKHPLLGIGMGKSPTVLMQYTSVGEFHSGYIEILVAGGILKFLIFFYIMISSFWYAYKVFKFNRMYGSFCISFWITFFIYMFFESFQIFGRSLTTLIPTFLMITFPRILYNNFYNGGKI